MADEVEEFVWGYGGTWCTRKDNRVPIQIYGSYGGKIRVSEKTIAAGMIGAEDTYFLSLDEINKTFPILGYVLSKDGLSSGFFSRRAERSKTKGFVYGKRCNSYFPIPKVKFIPDYNLFFNPKYYELEEAYEHITNLEAANLPLTRNFCMSISKYSDFPVIIHKDRIVGEVREDMYVHLLERMHFLQESVEEFAKVTY